MSNLVGGQKPQIEQEADEMVNGTFILHLRSKNDRNGNPRRLYLRIAKDGYIVSAYDEGYRGIHSVPKTFQDRASRAVSIETTPSEYKRLLRGYGRTT